jgi:dihydrofolate reductase
MRKLVLKMSISLDGYVAGPKNESEWIFRSTDEEAIAWELELVGHAGLHAMGSRTFHDMASYWPFSTESFADPMNRIPKAVFSRRTIGELTRDVGKRSPGLDDPKSKAQPGAKASAEPAPGALESWRQPRALSGPLAEEIRRLKDEPGGDVIVYGGARLAQSVIATGLVDEYYFLVHPAALGRGLPIFSSLEKPIDLELVASKSFAAGAVGQRYRSKR